MIFNNKQIVFIVPTETATNTIRNTRSVEKQADVIFFNTADVAFPFGINVLAEIDPSGRPKMTSTLLLTFRGI
tara:strand:+ start:320 stop:538 length:219 start_codon:yes stop_codon:yes gene_type:complete